MNEKLPTPKRFTPFELGEKIAKGGHMSDVYEAKKDPNYVVKKCPFVLIEDEDSMRMFKLHIKDCGKFTAFSRHYQANLLDMQKHVGKFMPKTQLIYGYDEQSEETGWIIAEKIFKCENESAQTERIKALDEVMSALIDMYFNKFEKEGDDYYGNGVKFVYMPDFLSKDEGEDLMYGYTISNSKPQYYLPDIYPMLKYDPVRLGNEIRNKIRPYGYENFPTTAKKLTELEKLIPPDRQRKIKK